MRIEIRDPDRRRMGRVIVDPAERPTRVSVKPRNAVNEQLPDAPSGDGRTPHTPREVFLNWESALDDAGQLRRCVVCGCPELFKDKAFPQVTGFVVVLAFVGAVIGALGLATNLPVLLTMTGVLVLDVAILLFSRRRLVCYSCRSTYHDLPIARYHRRWDRAVAERHPVQSMRGGGTSAPSSAGMQTAAAAPSGGRA